MDLWIRSQQKEMLFKVNESLILRNGPGERCFIECDGHKIAVYKTYERALEVLDEIQGKLKIICTDSTGGEYILAKNLIPIIYEMPKE